MRHEQGITLALRRQSEISNRIQKGYIMKEERIAYCIVLVIFAVPTILGLFFAGM